MNEIDDFYSLGKNKEPKSIKKWIINKLGGFTKEEILEKVEEYKVAKEMTRVNPLGSDYIFVYDLRTFCFKKKELPDFKFGVLVNNSK